MCFRCLLILVSLCVLPVLIDSKGLIDLGLDFSLENIWIKFEVQGRNPYVGFPHDLVYYAKVVYTVFQIEGVFTESLG